MKHTIFFLAFLLSFSLIKGQYNDNPRIANSKFNYVDGKIEISYELKNCNSNEKFFIWFEAYSKNSTLNVQTFSGDVGYVFPSGTKKIVWDLKTDGVLLNNTPLSIKLFARQQPQNSFGKAFLSTTIFPGSGHRQVGGRNNYLLGILGYGAILGSIYTNKKSVDNFNNYKIESDESKRNAFHDESKKYFAASVGLVGVAAAIWVFDYFRIAKLHKKTASISPKSNSFDYELLQVQIPEKMMSTRGNPPDLNANLSFTDENGNGILEALETATLSITLENRGKGDAVNLEVKISDSQYDSELSFKNSKKIPILSPQKSITLNFAFKAGIDIKTLQHRFKIEVTEGFGYDMDPAFLNLQTFLYQVPDLKFAGLEVNDAGTETFALGSPDAQLQAGEQIVLKIIVQNAGQNAAKEVSYSLISEDNNIYLEKNSGNFDKIEVGKTKEIFVKVSPNKRVTTTDKLPLYLTLKEKYGRCNLIRYQIPLFLNQKTSAPKILTLNSDVDKLKSNVAKFEYSSNKFNTTENLIQIKNPVPSKYFTKKRKKSLGIVIGIGNYETLLDAPYADKDAEIMKEYFEKVLGVEQVLFFTNEKVTSNKLKNIFKSYGQLAKNVVKGETEVFVYWSGHGVPQKDLKKTFLFPYDGIKEDLNGTAYDLDSLYANLNGLGAKKVFLFLDACFSGALRKSATIAEKNLTNERAAPVRKYIPDWQRNPNFVVFNSSTGEETSLSYDISQTGLFTYFLCAGLMGKADANNDKKISVGELNTYLSKNVVETSRKISGTQTPTFSGDEKIILTEY